MSSERSCSIKVMFTWDFEENCICISNEQDHPLLSKLRNTKLRNLTGQHPLGAEILIMGKWIPIVHVWTGGSEGNYTIKLKPGFKSALRRLAKEIQEEEGKSTRLYGIFKTPYIKPLQEIIEDKL